MINIDEGKNGDWIKSVRDRRLLNSPNFQKLQKSFNIKQSVELMSFFEMVGINSQSSYADMKKAYEEFS